MVLTNLANLLPMSFGPKDLGFFKNYLLDHVHHDIQLNPSVLEVNYLQNCVN
jgi:hypothetical protein